MSDIQFCIPFCSPYVIWFRKSIIPSRLVFFSWLSPHHFSSSFLLCLSLPYMSATSNLSLTFSNHVLLNPFFNLLCSWPFPLTRVQMCNWPVPLLLLCAKDLGKGVGTFLLFLYGSTWHLQPPPGSNFLPKIRWSCEPIEFTWKEVWKAQIIKKNAYFDIALEKQCLHETFHFSCFFRRVLDVIDLQRVLQFCRLCTLQIKQTSPCNSLTNYLPGKSVVWIFRHPRPYVPFPPQIFEIQKCPIEKKHTVCIMA